MTLMQVTMLSVTVASVIVSIFLIVITVLSWQLMNRLKRSFDRLDEVIQQGLLTSRTVHHTAIELMSKIEAIASVFSVLGIKRIMQTVIKQRKANN